MFEQIQFTKRNLKKIVSETHLKKYNLCDFDRLQIGYGTPNLRTNWNYLVYAIHFDGKIQLIVTENGMILDAGDKIW